MGGIRVIGVVLIATLPNSGEMAKGERATGMIRTSLTYRFARQRLCGGEDRTAGWQRIALICRGRIIGRLDGIEHNTLVIAWASLGTGAIAVGQPRRGTADGRE